MTDRGDQRLKIGELFLNLLQNLENLFGFVGQNLSVTFHLFSERSDDFLKLFESMMKNIARLIQSVAFVELELDEAKDEQR